MKTVLLLALLVCFAFAGSSQGTLQFNQVKLVTSSETVPSGKVWKIVNVLPGANFITAMACGNSGNNNSLVVDILIGGSTVTVMASRSCSSNNLFGSILTSPIWLPSGISLAVSTNASKISVIEFNVIP